VECNSICQLYDIFLICVQIIMRVCYVNERIFIGTTVPLRCAKFYSIKKIAKKIQTVVDATEL